MRIRKLTLLLSTADKIGFFSLIPSGSLDLSVWCIGNCLISVSSEVFQSNDKLMPQLHIHHAPSKIPLLLQGCEREVAEAEKGSSDELKSECLLRLSWALVHSKRSEDVQRGIAMLEGKHLYMFNYYYYL